jgi:hypothetical protein
VAPRRLRACRGARAVVEAAAGAGDAFARAISGLAPMRGAHRVPRLACMGMRERLGGHLRGNVVAYLALFVALGGTAYAANEWTGENIVDGSLTGVDIKNLSVQGKDLAENTVPSSRIVDESVGAVDLAPGSVGASELQNGAVLRERIALAAVNAGRLAPGAVVGSKLADGSVSNPKLAAGAVTAAKIAPGAVGTREHGVVPAVRVWRNAGMHPSSLSDMPAIPWNREIFDTAGMWSPDAPTRITAPVAGLYQVSAIVQVADKGELDQRWIDVVLRYNGGTPVFYKQSPQGQGLAQNFAEVSTLVRLRAGDWLDLGLSASGSGDSVVESRNQAYPTLSAHWIGPG